jgi:hypothetical protein
MPPILKTQTHAYALELSNALIIEFSDVTEPPNQKTINMTTSTT